MLKCLFIFFLLVPHILLAGHVEKNERARTLANDARALWQSHDLTYYTFTMDRGGVFGSTKYRVRVEAGDCVKVTYWRRIWRRKDTCENRTIEELFDELYDAIQDNPVDIWLEFDPVYGFPREVYVEPRSDLTDQGWGYRISRFDH